MRAAQHRLRRRDRQHRDRSAHGRERPRTPAGGPGPQLLARVPERRAGRVRAAVERLRGRTRRRRPLRPAWPRGRRRAAPPADGGACRGERGGGGLGPCRRPSDSGEPHHRGHRRAEEPRLADRTPPRRPHPRPVRHRGHPSPSPRRAGSPRLPGRGRPSPRPRTRRGDLRRPLRPPSAPLRGLAGRPGTGHGLVARVDRRAGGPGGGVAVLLTRDDRSATAWIHNLGVRDSARGQGLGGRLLRHAFGVYAARGRERIGLGVDTGNATGALRLYAAHGMTLHFSAETWETTLPAAPAR
ncbi:GNAT family N-acetyltransferase [Streptomyces daqingensis]|uniref:GNAT family N-acetyltransferase n=1 Tax=Streptomyces daqingensis TaxID=1472640 RepID=UPI0027E41E35|nr:GNAT family N-acetyltransferase [Streptomyces daqingensis]